MKRFVFFIVLLLNLMGLRAQDTVLYFDGVDDFADIGSTVATNVRTIEFWFKPEIEISPNLLVDQTMISRDVGGANIDEFVISFIQYNFSKPGAIGFAIHNGVGNYSRVESDSTHWDAGLWHHLACVIHPTQGMIMFVDGIKQTDSYPYYTPIVSNNNPTVLGCIGSPSFIRYFNGCIDDLHMSTDALYSNNFIPPCPNRALETSSQGLYYFNEGSGAIVNDESANQSPGSLSGAVFQTDTICQPQEPTYQDHTVLYFDGVDDVADLGPSVAANVRTIELWFKPEIDITPSLPIDHTLVSRETSSSNYDEFVLCFYQHNFPKPGAICFAVHQGVSNYYTVLSDSTHWDAGVWHHLACVIHPTQGMIMFVDGKRQSGSYPYYNAIIANSFSTKLGCVGTVGGPAIRYYNGCIDDLHFSTDALYTADFTPPCPNRTLETSSQGLYYFNEGSGAIINDESANQSPGSLAGPVFLTDTICHPQEPVPEGKTVLCFDGVDDYADLGPDIADGIRSVEFWFKPDNLIDPLLPDYQTLICRDSGSSNINEFAIYFMPAGSSNPGSVCFEVNQNTGSSYQVFSNTNSWAAGQWYHMACIIHPAHGMMMFVDGVLQSLSQTYSSPLAANTAPTYLGCWGSSHTCHFYGCIEDLHISTDALYTADFTPPCPDRAIELSSKGLYYFNEGSGIDIYDQTMLFDGTLYGPVYLIDTVCETAIISEDTMVYCFDGIDDMIRLDAGAADMSRTIEFWMKLNSPISPSLAEYQTVLARGNGMGNEGEFKIAFNPSYVANSGHLSFKIVGAGGVVYEVKSDNDSWQTGSWYHIAIIIHHFNGMQMYINGMAQTGTAASYSPIPSDSLYTYIACDGHLSAQFFDGCLDDLRFSSAPLYSSTFLPPCPNIGLDNSTTSLYDFNLFAYHILNDIGPANHSGFVYDASATYENPCMNITSIGDISQYQNTDISIYPNPVESVLYIKNEEDAEMCISVYNMLGQLLNEVHVSSHQYALELPYVAGMYMIRISTANKIRLKEIIIKK